jgi:electron transport complex protein RnfB
MNGGHQIWTMGDVKAAIPKQKKYWISNCGCREEKGKKCKHGLHTCLGFDPEYTSTKSALSEADRAEVDKLIAFAEKEHLVPRPWVSDKGEIKASCFCCPCCCYYITTGKDNVHGKMIEKTDMGVCTSCGACVEYCYFGARALKDGELKVDSKKCMGCGVCVATCPTEAIVMEKR